MDLRWNQKFEDELSKMENIKNISYKKLQKNSGVF